MKIGESERAQEPALEKVFWNPPQLLVIPL